MQHSIQAVKQRFGIIGRSEKLNNALHTAIRVAATDLTVLISGESGVGKEVFSKVIHSLSHRKHQQFIAINCGAIPAGTINSELFGHVKGAFTGATGERKGYFEAVDGGTIFLDEIGEMPQDTQAYLLRVLENGEYLKVGSSTPQTTDVRVIAATNVDLHDQVLKGKFREDLYYRLNTVGISVPPLRERHEDIYMLFRKFCLDFSEEHHIEPIELDDKARQWLSNYHWPGNIRELKNMAEQLSILAERRKIDAEDLLELMPQLRNRNLPSIPNKNNVHMQEREILYQLLFDMKSDLNHLKALVHDLIQENDLKVNKYGPATSPSLPDGKIENQLWEIRHGGEKKDTPTDYGPNRTHEKNEDEAYHRIDLVDLEDVAEELVSLEDMEKQMIKKALKKYKGKRRSAAEELGISERTLYRKIKQYDLEL